MGLPKLEDELTEGLFCRICGTELFEENTQCVPTERRGWIIFVPHFCCCGRCSWDCKHDHAPLDVVCAHTDITHSESIIRKES